MKQTKTSNHFIELFVLLFCWEKLSFFIFRNRPRQKWNNLQERKNERNREKKRNKIICRLFAECSFWKWVIGFKYFKNKLFIWIKRLNRFVRWMSTEYKRLIYQQTDFGWWCCCCCCVGFDSSIDTVLYKQIEWKSTAVTCAYIVYYGTQHIHWLYPLNS